MAGIVDGEGTVYVGRRKPIGRELHPRYHIRVVVTNTSAELMQWIQARWSGSLHAHPGNKKPCWNWVVTGYKAAGLLEEISPYMVIKKAQAELCLEFWRAIKRNRGFTSVEELATRETYYRKSRVLNGAILDVVGPGF